MKLSHDFMNFELIKAADSKHFQLISVYNSYSDIAAPPNSHSPSPMLSHIT